MNKVSPRLRALYEKLYEKSPLYKEPIVKEKKVHFSKLPKKKYVFVNLPDWSLDPSTWMEECPFTPD